MRLDPHVGVKKKGTAVNIPSSAWEGGFVWARIWCCTVQGFWREAQ